MDLKPTQTQIADVIDAARAIIERGGWCRHVAADGDARCLVGALAEAATTLRIGQHRVPGYLLFREARTVCERYVPKQYSNLPDFNDGTSQRDVVGLLMRAATELRSR